MYIGTMLHAHVHVQYCALYSRNARGRWPKPVQYRSTGLTLAAVDGRLPTWTGLAFHSLAKGRGMGYYKPPSSRFDQLVSLLPKGTIAYRTPKYIKVDIAWLAVFHRILQFVVLVGALIRLYFNDGWALTEVPTGSSNAWEEVGSMESSTSDPTRAGRTQYCSSAAHTYEQAAYRYTAPPCESLLPGELVVKTPDSIFFTTSIHEKVTLGWPCAATNASVQSAACVGRGGATYSRGNGQCGCVTTRSLYPLAVEEMRMIFEHSFEADLLDFNGNSVNEQENDLWSDVIFSNGTRLRFKAGEVIGLPLTDWLSAADVTLDAANANVRPDAQGRLAMKRTTGVTLRIEVEYSNQELDVGRPVPGKHSVHAFVRAKAEHSTWTGGQTWVRWRVEPLLPRDTPQEYHLVERSRQGVLFVFDTKGMVYKFDFWMALAILVSTVVLLQVANIIADGIAFYCLPGGQSTVLRHKRDELVSKKSEFAELGMKAALAATTYRAFDPDNNGAIDPVDIVKVFAHVEGITWEQAHSIAYMIMDDADTDVAEAEGQAGLSFEEYMTCLEGDAINFRGFLANVEANLSAPDREECRRAFEEERASLPAPSKGVRLKAAEDQQDVKLALTDEERKARLEKEGILKLHLISGSALKAADRNGKSDPFCVIMVGNKMRQSMVKKKTLEPVWDQGLDFKPTKLDRVCKRGMKIFVKDKDLFKDEIIGEVTVKLDALEDHSTLSFTERLSPQGELKFVIKWEEVIAVSMPSPERLPSPTRLPPPKGDATGVTPSPTPAKSPTPPGAKSPTSPSPSAKSPSRKSADESTTASSAAADDAPKKKKKPKADGGDNGADESTAASSTDGSEKKKKKRTPRADASLTSETTQSI